MRPGAKAELVTARRMFGGKKSIGLGTIAAYRMDPKQRMQRLHYAMACAKWGTLSSGDKAAYEAWAEANNVTVFSSFLHSYLAELKTKLSLYLPLEKIVSGEAEDFSQYGNDGTVANCIVDPDGYIGKAFDFNGTNSTIDCGDSDSLKIEGDLTLMLWLYLETWPASNNRLVKKSYQHEFALKCENNGAIMLLHGDGAHETAFQSAAGVITTNKWFHVTLTRNLSTKKCTLYINGLQEGAQDTFVKTPTTSASHARVGSADGNLWHDGLLDEVRIYDKCLITEEIRAAYIQESKWHGDVA